jgi:hypothetical protein
MIASKEVRGVWELTIWFGRYGSNDKLNGQNEPDNGKVDVEEVQLGKLLAHFYRQFA